MADDEQHWKPTPDLAKNAAVLRAAWPDLTSFNQQLLRDFSPDVFAGAMETIRLASVSFAYDPSPVIRAAQAALLGATGFHDKLISQMNASVTSSVWSIDQARTAEIMFQLRGVMEELETESSLSAAEEPHSAVARVQSAEWGISRMAARQILA